MSLFVQVCPLLFVFCFFTPMCLLYNASGISLYSTQGATGPDGPVGDKGVMGMKVKYSAMILVELRYCIISYSHDTG